MPQSVSGESFFGRFSSSARSSIASKDHKATVQLLDDSETIQCEYKGVPLAEKNGDVNSNGIGKDKNGTLSTANGNHHNSTAAKSNESPKGKRGAQQILKYQCPSATFAKHLWRHTLSQQAFFTVSRATDFKPKFSKPRIPLLSRGSTFRYTGRVLHEIEEAEPPVREKPMLSDDFHHPHVSHGSNTSTESARGTSVPVSSSVGSGVPPSSPPCSLVCRVLMNALCHSSVASVSSAPTRIVGASETTPGFMSSNAVVLTPSTIPEEDLSLLANASAYRSEIHNWSTTDPKPLANSTPKKVEAARNGTVYHAQPLQSVESGGCQRILRSLLTGLLFTFIFITIVIAIFEVKDRHFQQYVHAVPGAEHLRHQLYEPSREFILEQYNRVTSGHH
uniref:FERM adjacent (FA) domain-containing protein n=1 Tax=Plectus sambesii TaxID=2011161 RepID=A0A914V5R8_9BILA